GAPMRVFVSAAILLAIAAPAMNAGAERRRIPAVDQQSSTTQSYAFPSGAGMLFFYVKPDRTSDFEAVVSRFSQTLDHAEDPIRKQQAAGWRIMKSVEVTRDAAIYVFLFDPAVSGADYDPVKILSEKQPPDIQPLYEKLRDSTIRVERMGLTKIR